MGAVDNDADLHNHIISQRTKLPPRVKDIAYEQHSVCDFISSLQPDH